MLIEERENKHFYSLIRFRGSENIIQNIGIKRGKPQLLEAEMKILECSQNRTWSNFGAMLPKCQNGKRMNESICDGD